MSKIGKPRLKKMRRVGADLGLMSGIRPLESKGKINTRPGVHGAKRVRISDYGVNLRSKQTVQTTYGLLNKQLRSKHLLAMRQMKAARKQGKTAQYELLIALASKVDAVVYHMGFASTLRAARQLVSHGKVHVNGIERSSPNSAVKSGSVIEVHPTEGQLPNVIQSLELSAKEPDKNWITLEIDQDKKVFKGTFVRAPSLEELPASLLDIQDDVIQFYSK